ncbi:MAG: mechanosensitive ion channel family protein [Myxococcaceae bacterium]
MIKLVSKQIVRRLPTFDKKILRAAFTPVRFGFALSLFVTGARFVDVPDSWLPYIDRGALVLSAFILTWLVFSVVDLLGEWWAEHLRETGQIGMIGTIPLGRRTLKVAVTILALITFLQNIGVHVTALLAGLGVGGIALALGAQKMIGDLIGGIMLVLDRPIRVGDDCIFGTQIGKVEEIGIRTTRIRTPDRSVISVPNADFSQMQLENLSVRDRIRFNCVIGIHRASTPDQLRYLLVEFRKLLYAHPKIDQEPARVRLVAVGASSLDIEINAYVLTNQNAEFLAVREDLFLRFLDKVREAGTSLALPMQENILSAAIEPAYAKGQVELWRSKNELGLPEFSESQIEALDDSLDYPPRGSVILSD